MTGASERGIHAADLLPLLAGVAALAIGTAFGWDARLVNAIVSPPPVIRAVLVGVSALSAVVLLVAALRRLGAGRNEEHGASDLPTMIRGIRLVFLSLAALSAAAGWLVGHPLPLVVALVIAGVDVIETSFLLLVVRRRT